MQVICVAGLELLHQGAELLGPHADARQLAFGDA